MAGPLANFGKSWSFRGLDNVEYGIYIFLSEPPTFSDPIQTIYVSKCSPYLFVYTIPSIYDPDSNLLTISFQEIMPKWIFISNITKLNDVIYSISIDCTSRQSCSSVSGILRFTLILSDESGAFTKYPIDIEFVSQSIIKFDHINDMNVNISKSTSIPLSIGNSRFEAKECSTRNEINWICYSSTDALVFILDQSKCSVNYDQCSISEFIGSHCVNLCIIDNCENQLCSNEFNINVASFQLSSFQLNFSSINVYANYYTEIAIPNNLFYSPNDNSDLYSTSCIDNSNIRIATKIFTNDQTNESSLYVKVYGDTGCNITIVDRNSYCQSSEVVVSINVIGCASKECTQCKGPTDSDCLQCKQGYVLDSSGSCLVDVSFVPSTNYKFFWICGVIAMVSCFTQIILSFKYDKDSFDHVSDLQTVIIITLSFNSVSSSWIEYIYHGFRYLNLT